MLICKFLLSLSRESRRRDFFFTLTFGKSSDFPGAREEEWRNKRKGRRSSAVFPYRAGREADATEETCGIQEALITKFTRGAFVVRRRRGRAAGGGRGERPRGRPRTQGQRRLLFIAVKAAISILSVILLKLESA